MIKSTMVKGDILVRATKIKTDNPDEFILEFKLTENQSSCLIAELLVEHVKNNTLTVIHENHSDKDKILIFLKGLIDSNPNMSDEIRNEYFKTILDLTK